MTFLHHAPFSCIEGKLNTSNTKVLHTTCILLPAPMNQQGWYAVKTMVLQLREALQRPYQGGVPVDISKASSVSKSSLSESGWKWIWSLSSDYPLCCTNERKTC